MATITPAITTSATPGIQLTMPGNTITYDEFMNMLGEWVFKVQTMYYLTTNIAQFNTPIAYSAYDVNGNVDGKKIVTPVSPGQFQASQYVQLKGNGIIADGQSQLDFNLLANSQMQLIFYCIRKRVQDDIDNAGLTNNFEMAESEMGLSGFFRNNAGNVQTEEEVYPDDY